MRNAAGARGECGQRVPAARQRVHLESLKTQPFHHGSANAGGSAGDQSKTVIGKRHMSPWIGRETLSTGSRLRQDVLGVVRKVALMFGGQDALVSPQKD